MAQAVVPAQPGALAHAEPGHGHDTNTGVSNAKLAIWLFLSSEALFFGAFITTYFLYRGRDTLYLKVDDGNRPDYERAGAKMFKPYRDRPGTMHYYAVPVDVLESPLDLSQWARKAVAAAERAGAPPR